MHVAILDEELPYPLTSGKRIRSYNLLCRLARQHRLTYICHRNADANEARAAVAHFHELGIETKVVDRRIPPKAGPGFAARLAANLFSPLPYSVATHESAALRRAALEFNAVHRVDLWHCEWTPYAQTMRTLPGTRWVVMAHNVESLIWQRLAENERRRLRRWYILRQHRKYFEFERWAYNAATCAVAVSREDAALMHDWFGASNVRVVDNGVDADYFQPQPRTRDPKSLLFLGSLDWRPNLDAVSVLLDMILPGVRSLEPEARLVIVGRNPPEWLRKRTQQLGVELYADVPDVRPYLAEAGVLAVPLRIGGGSRLKILEALASGLPVVSTKVGAEGLDLERWRHLDVVDSIGPMADALVNAMRQPKRMAAQAEEARRHILTRYNWDTLADQLEHVWLDCAGHVVGNRAA